MTRFDIDAPGNNHAIYQDQEDGRRQITIVSMLEGDQFEYVRFDLVVDFAAGDGDLVQGPSGEAVAVQEGGVGEWFGLFHAKNFIRVKLMCQ